MSSSDIAGGAAPGLIGGGITGGAYLATHSASLSGWGIGGGVGGGIGNVVNTLQANPFGGSGPSTLSVAAPSGTPNANPVKPGGTNAVGQASPPRVVQEAIGQTAPPVRRTGRPAPNDPVFCGDQGTTCDRSNRPRTEAEKRFDEIAKFFRVTSSPTYTNQNVTEATKANNAEHYQMVTRVGPTGHLSLGSVRVAAPNQRLVRIPPTPNLAMMVHSHFEFVDPGDPTSGVEFSYQDIAFARQRNAVIYVVGPDYSMKSFDPATNAIHFFEPE